MINIVIPMAGAGSRFKREGYSLPKPLIPVDGKPMIRLVIENLRPAIKHRFVFICQQSHVEEFNLNKLLREWAPGSEIVTVDGLTEGAACTVLAAESIINTNEQLMIANSDQYVDVNINDYINKMDVNHLNGLIMTMTANDPKWSYVGLDKGFVTRVVEKEVISNEATVGIYNFRSGRDFVSAANQMISKNLRVNNEFYVAPVYNELILQGAKIGVYNVGTEGAGMYGLGIPSDLLKFLTLPICIKATDFK
jgi:NDP-sugar pyrophosphorylase family protein